MEDKSGNPDGVDKALRNRFTNEDGLPIVEITEPDEGPDPVGKEQSFPTELDEIIPLAQLSHEQKGRLKEERDRILDQLEEEERADRAELRQRALQQSNEALQRRKEAATNEQARVKAARDVQRKMAKALVQDTTQPERQRPPVDEVGASTVQSAHGCSSVKKGVKFAESRSQDATPAISISDWGDITPARLQSSLRPTLLVQSQVNRLPMKMNVVERQSSNPHPLKPEEDLDSDDELDVIDSQSESDSGDETSNSGMAPDDGGEELDFASHQREIALEYQKKRATIVSDAMTAVMHEETGGRPLVIHDLPISEDRPKPAISHFRANRFAEAYNTTTPGASPDNDATLSASTSRTLQRAIRTGKLDENNRLVSMEDSDGESDKELQDAQEIMELLRKGEATNVGPNGDRGTVGVADKAIPDAKTLPPPTMINKTTSRFKASREQMGKLGSPTATNIGKGAQLGQEATGTVLAGAVLERKQPVVAAKPSTLAVTNRHIAQQSSAASDEKFSAPLNPFSMIVESPDFPPPRPASQSRPNRPPVVLSSVKEARPVGTSAKKT